MNLFIASYTYLEMHRCCTT